MLTVDSHSKCQEAATIFTKLFSYVCFLFCVFYSPLLEFGPALTLTWSLEMASMLVEVLKVDMDGQGFSCLEAAIGRHEVQVM